MYCAVWEAQRSSFRGSHVLLRVSSMTPVARKTSENTVVGQNYGLLLLESWLQGNPLFLRQQLHVVICNLFFLQHVLKRSVHNLNVVIKWVILPERMWDTGHACDYTNIILLCMMSPSLCDELSADSVPNEDIHMTCKSRRLDER